MLVRGGGEFVLLRFGFLYCSIFPEYQYKIKVSQYRWHKSKCSCLQRKKHIPHLAAAAATKSLQSCPILCNPIDGSPQGSPVPGILQARTLEWVAISFSSPRKWKVKVKSLSRAGLLATPWTAAYQAPPSMDFSGKSTGVGCHCLLPSSSYHSAYIYYYPAHIWRNS